MPSAQQIRYPTRPVMCASTVLCAHGSRVGMSRGVAGEPSLLGREEAHTALQESIRFTRPRKQKLAAKPILRRRLSVSQSEARTGWRSSVPSGTPAGP